MCVSGADYQRALENDDDVLRCIKIDNKTSKLVSLTLARGLEDVIAFFRAVGGSFASTNRYEEHTRSANSRTTSLIKRIKSYSEGKNSSRVGEKEEV
jgi:hypothetical protein